MTKIEQKRNQEKHDSMSFAVKSFAVGTVLIIAFALTGMPGATDGDVLLASAEATTVQPVSAAVQAPAAASAAPSARIEVPFKVNAGDVEPLTSQF